MAVPAAKVYEAMKHPLVKRQIDELGKILYGTDDDVFTVSESVDCPELIALKGRGYE